MRIQLLQAAHLGGKSYKQGVHDLPEAAVKDRFFHKLVQAGLAIDAEGIAPVLAESLQQRQARLAEKLAKMKTPEPRPPVVASVHTVSAPPAQAPMAENHGEIQDGSTPGDGESDGSDLEVAQNEEAPAKVEAHSSKHKKHKR